MRCGVHDVGCGMCQGMGAARKVEARGIPKRMPEVWERFDRVSCVAMVSWSEAVQSWAEAPDCGALHAGAAEGEGCGSRWRPLRRRHGGQPRHKCARRQMSSVSSRHAQGADGVGHVEGRGLSELCRAGAADERAPCCAC
jgi:hypothetical protein